MGAACSAATPDPSLRYASSGGAAAAPQARLDCAAFAFRHAGAVADVSAACGAIATAGEDGALALHCGQSGRLLRRWHGAHARAATRVSLRNVGAEGAGALLLASASRDLTVALRHWAATDGNGDGESGAGGASAIVLRGHEFTVTALHLSCGGARLCSGSRDTSVRVWDVAAGALSFSAVRAQNIVTCIKWHPGFGVIDGGSGSGGGSSSDEAGGAIVFLQGAEDLRVRLWDTRAGLREVGALTGFTYFPLGLDVSACGRYVLTSSKGFSGVGCELRLWDLRGWKGGDAGPGGGGLVASPQTPLSSGIFDTGSDKSVPHSWKQVRQLQGHVQDASACAFVGDAAFAPGSSGDYFRGESAATSGAAGYFVSGSKDGSVRLWAGDSGRCLGEHAVPDGGSCTALSVLPWAAAPASEAAGADSSGPRVAASSSEGGLFVFVLGRDATFRLVTATAWPS